MTKDALGALFFVMGALNILCTLIIPALKEKRATKIRRREIDNNYNFEMLLLEIKRNEWEKDMYEWKLLLSKSIKQPNSFSDSSPLPKKRN